MFDPKDLLIFTELRGFQTDWKQLGLNVEQDLLSLQWAIMESPRAGAVIQGTGGLRKLRFAPPRWGTGKRGALRVLYVYFEEYGHVLLVTAYAKNEDDRFSEADKKQVKFLIEEERQLLGEIYSRDN